MTERRTETNELVRGGGKSKQNCSVIDGDSWFSFSLTRITRCITILTIRFFCIFNWFSSPQRRTFKTPLLLPHFALHAICFVVCNMLQPSCITALSWSTYLRRDCHIVFTTDIESIIVFLIG